MGSAWEAITKTLSLVSCAVLAGAGCATSGRGSAEGSRPASVELAWKPLNLSFKQSILPQAPESMISTTSVVGASLAANASLWVASRVGLEVSGGMLKRTLAYQETQQETTDLRASALLALSVSPRFRLGIGPDVRLFPYYSIPSMDSGAIVVSRALAVYGSASAKLDIGRGARDRTTVEVTAGIPLLLSGGNGDALRLNGGLRLAAGLDWTADLGARAYLGLGGGVSYESLKYVQSAPIDATGRFSMFEQFVRLGLGYRY